MSADYLVVGDWNVRCDRCGKKLKGSQAVETWQGYWVCQEHWEPRQPQDFVRAIVEHPTPDFVRNPADVILPFADGIVLEDDPATLPDIIPGADLDYILPENGITWLISET